MGKTINTRQLAVIIFIVTVSSKIFMLPALLLSISGRDSWLTVIAYFVLEILVLALIIAAAKKNPHVNVYEFLSALLGKWAARAILIIVAAFYIFKMTIMISEIKVFFTITATENLNWQLCIIPFLVMLGLVSLKSLRSIARVCEIFMPFVGVSLIIMGVIMAKNMDFSNLLPLFENGIRGNLYSMLMVPIWLTDFSLLTIFLGKIEHRKRIMSVSLIACTLSFIAVLYFNIVMYTEYSYAPELLSYGHNITNMVLYPVGTYNYGRFDLVVFAVWMIGLIIHVALLFYAAARHISSATKIKNNYITALIMMAALFILIQYVFADDLRLYSYAVSALNYVTFAIEILLPVLVFISSQRYKKRQEGRVRLLTKVRFRG